MQLTKHYLMLFGLISLFVLQGASIKLRSNSHSLTQASACSSLTGEQALLFDVGDVDGDGIDDFIVRLRKTDSCKPGDSYLMIATGKGDFKREELDCSLNFKGLDTTLTFADLNGDGRKDIIRTEKGESSAEILFYIAHGQFLRFSLPSSYELASDSCRIEVGDYDGDGKDDFIRHEKDAPAQVFLSTCSLKGVSFKKVTIPESETTIKIVVGDYNGDKKDDFIAQEKTKDGYTGHLFLSEGDGEFTKTALPESCSIENGKLPLIHVGDFNQDKKDDFIYQTTCITPKPSAWHWIDWTTFTPAKPLPGTPASGAGTIVTNTDTVQVTYTGDAFNAATAGQFKGFVNAPTGTYVNGPTNGDALYFNLAQRDETITFSRPVVNPRIAVWSLGQLGLPVTHDFSPYQLTLVSTGPNKEYYNVNSRIEILGNSQVRGYEGNGVFEVIGTFTQLTFKKLQSENWYALTIAISDVDPTACPPTSLYLADDGDFTNVAIPKEWDLDGSDADLYVGDFNCDGRNDFLRFDTGADVNEITPYASALSPSALVIPPFVEAEVFDTTCSVKDNRPSTLYLGDFNGDTRTDYIQYWSDSCYEIVTARYAGACTASCDE